MPRVAHSHAVQPDSVLKKHPPLLEIIPLVEQPEEPTALATPSENLQHLLVVLRVLIQKVQPQVVALQYEHKDTHTVAREGEQHEMGQVFVDDGAQAVFS